MSPRLMMIALSLMVAAGAYDARAQVENVPVQNQVYEYLDRLGVRGILPLASVTMIPMSRAAVAGLLSQAEAKRSDLSPAEAGYLDKFRQEFAREPGLAGDAAGLFNGSPFAELFSEREKYLYHYADSSATLYLEFIGSLEHRGGRRFVRRDHASFETHGFRASTSGAARIFCAGDQRHALWRSELRPLGPPPPHKRQVQRAELALLDFAEAYLRDLSWFNLNSAGILNSARLFRQADPERQCPALDLIKIDASYGSVRYVSSRLILLEPEWFAGLGPRSFADGEQVCRDPQAGGIAVGNHERVVFPRR